MTDRLTKPFTPVANEKNASEFSYAAQSSGTQGNEAVKDILCGSVSGNRFLRAPLSHQWLCKTDRWHGRQNC